LYVVVSDALEASRPLYAIFNPKNCEGILMPPFF
jgi:hypothetical protein